MSRRSRAREVALQVLYQEDLNPPENAAAADRLLARRLRRTEVLEFGRSLVSGVRRHRPELDRMITAVAENWSLERMAVTDRNVLRLGVYEVLYGDTPGAVAVNEAIDLAKRYGTPQSAQFVNGVLDRLVRQQQAAGSGQPAAESGT